MRFMLRPKEPTWWVWLLTALLLAVGLVGWPVCFLGAIALSVAQAAWFLGRDRSLKPYPVQIRVAYAVCLPGCLLPRLGWMFWPFMLGTFARVLFGYCPMARILSLMPWNRNEPMTLSLLSRTFLTPPMTGNPAHGLPEVDGGDGVCNLEARIAMRS